MKELGIFYVYKKRNNTISQMLGELGTKEEELDYQYQRGKDYQYQRGAV